MRQYIQKLKEKKSLAQSEMEHVMHAIMSGSAKKEDIAQFLLALREKGPTIEEITGAARMMRRFVLPIVTRHKVVLDTCGTGGDKKNTFNISTLTALTVASAGVAVAKHGNRSVSSKCGSADILEALGVNLNLDEKQLSACLDEVGIAFLFAQKLHPAMKNVAPIRKELGVETIFNILGPLTNPANATHQMMGVYSREYVEPMVQVLKNLGLKKALAVHGNDGLDEITTTDKTFICELSLNKDIISYDIDPQELGFARASEADLKGGDLKENLKIVEDILNGKKGLKYDIVALNAAYAIYTAEKTSNIEQAVKLAKDCLDSGRVLEKLEDLKRFTQHAA